jgi:glycine/D-amino acid oxidase-like deaminating enzyme
MQQASILIIGGGIIGLSTAYHLARRGFSHITVLEKDNIGAGSSSRAAGIITGLLWSDTGVLARKISLQRFHELSDELPGYRFQAVGALNLFDPPTWPARSQLLPLYDRHGINYEILTAAEIRQRWPELTPSEEIIGLHDPLGGYSEPDEMLPALARRCRELGVEIREQSPITGFVEQSGRIEGVTLQDGLLGADVIVCTVHAWMGVVLAQLGTPVPVKAFVHQRFVTTALESAINIPAVNANPQGGYLRPASGNRILVGGGTDPNNHPNNSHGEEVRVTSLGYSMESVVAPAFAKGALTRDVTPLLPRLAQTQWEFEKAGLICYSVDGERIQICLWAAPFIRVALPTAQPRGCSWQNWWQMDAHRSISAPFHPLVLQ